MNHTIQLINNNAANGLEELSTQNRKVDCVLTTFTMDYFYEDTVKEVLEGLGCQLKNILIGDGSIYIRLKIDYIPLVSYVFQKCGFNLKNILTIPILGVKTPHHPKKYIDENLEYFLFFTHKDSSPRYLNPVKHNENACSCKFSANWSWFEGSLLDAYRMILKISTNHSDVVLDPFMDAGLVGEACILQDRNFIGIEISRARFDDTKRRLDELGE